jgi:pyrimidine operon attenuation protein/uracil phosphoribosyltransferase
MAEVVEILSAEEVRRTVNRLASQLVERSGDLSKLVLLGIYTRGAYLAPMLARQIEVLEGVALPVGAIDITFYRDDLDTIGLRTPNKTEIPFDLSGKTVVLVDDVIFKAAPFALPSMQSANTVGRS